MSVTAMELSKAVAYALRHEPWRYELELDDEGWTPVDQLIESLREQGGRWTAVDRDAMERMIASSSKRRYELVADRIRALYGHSIPGRIQKTRADPPERLLHGTSPEAWESIRAVGLRPMRRQYVHLSIDEATALAVGRRKSSRPLLLAVDAAAAHRAGVVFYQGNDMVWLSEPIPAGFVRPLE